MPIATPKHGVAQPLPGALCLVPPALLLASLPPAIHALAWRVNDALPMGQLGERLGDFGDIEAETQALLLQNEVCLITTAMPNNPSHNPSTMAMCA